MTLAVAAVQIGDVTTSAMFMCRGRHEGGRSTLTQDPEGHLYSLLHLSLLVLSLIYIYSCTCTSLLLVLSLIYIHS